MMTDLVSTALMPTGDSEHPVALNLLTPHEGDTEYGSRSQSKDMSNRAADESTMSERDEPQILHTEVTATSDGAVVKLQLLQDSPGVLDAAAESDQVAAGASSTAEPQTAAASYGDFSQYGDNLIAGSPAAEAMQLDTTEASPASVDTEAGDQQHSNAPANFGAMPAADINSCTRQTPANNETSEQAPNRESTFEDKETPTDDASAERSAPTTAEAAEPAEDTARTAAMPEFTTPPPPPAVESEAGAAPPAAAMPDSSSTAARDEPPSAPLTGQSALLVANKPSALLTEVARSLVMRGARVTVAVKHTGDGQIFVKKLQRHLPADQQDLLSSTACPINFASQTSIKKFASAINASDEPLNLLLLHTVETAAASARRWYTPEGAAGTAQLRFLGPATLLHLLHPKLTSDHTSVILTTTPLHRLGHLDDVDDMLSSWAGASVPETQLALLAYARQLAERCREQGITVAAVDMGPLREQPLAGSLLRKVPPLHQLLHLLLPSAREAAHLLSSITEDMTAEKGLPKQGTAVTEGGMNPLNDATTEAAATDMPTVDSEAAGQQDVQPAASLTSDLKYLELMMQQENDSSGVPAEQTAAPAEVGSTTEEPPAYEGDAPKFANPSYAEAPAGAVEAGDDYGGGVNYAKEQLLQKVGGSRASEGSAGADMDQKSVAAAGKGGADGHPFRYLSRGLLATPLLTAVDLAGRSSWLLHAFSNITAPFYQLAAGSVVRGTMLMDWPVRAWLLAPAGIASRWGKSVLGQRAAQLLAQLQKGVPGVEGVPHTAAPEWVVVKPAGLVMNDKLGARVWQVVEEAATA